LKFSDGVVQPDRQELNVLDGDADLARKWSTGGHNSDTNRFVGGLCTVVTRGQFRGVFQSRECHMGVINCATRDPELRKYLRDAFGSFGSENEWRCKSLDKQMGGINGSQPQVPGKASEDRVRFGQRVTAEGDFPAMPPTDHIGMSPVRLHEKRDSDAGIKCNQDQRRPASMSAKTESSSINVSPEATSTPDSLTSCAVRPASTKLRPAP
jgi:hypothetical protein